MELSETLGLTHFLLATPAMLAEFEKIVSLLISLYKLLKLKSNKKDIESISIW
ncbi:hypothetical protein L965_169 [Leuconostoc pseudomesenteroides PS12]|nr:hypothetical protein L964_1733 [Leuconostoc pseudomesenteroides 1159]KDA50311.1 hypothetical protein L965_169 [Leuconostoc pseudomesenteroides PS12]CCJ67409.1 hypothetical protein Q5C_08595 [Leuconostoc pseudomesenteroides 4882]